MAQGMPALHTSTKHLSILKYQETISSQMNISEKFFISLTVQIHIWPLLARFLHDAFTDHHNLASQEWLRLGSDVLHMAILILHSAEFLGSWGVWPLFLAVSKGWAGSIQQVSVCSPGLISLTAWELPRSGFPRPAHLNCHPATGTATALLAQKSHPVLTECFVVRLLLRLHRFSCSWSCCIYIKHNWLSLLVLNF